MLGLIFPTGCEGSNISGANPIYGEGCAPRMENTVVGLRTLVALLVVSLQLCCRAFDSGE
jgi:hypothetical protein